MSVHEGSISHHERRNSRLGDHLDVSQSPPRSTSHGFEGNGFHEEGHRTPHYTRDTSPGPRGTIQEETLRLERRKDAREERELAIMEERERRASQREEEDRRYSRWQIAMKMLDHDHPIVRAKGERMVDELAKAEGLAIPQTSAPASARSSASYASQDPRPRADERGYQTYIPASYAYPSQQPQVYWTDSRRRY